MSTEIQISKKIVKEKEFHLTNFYIEYYDGTGDEKKKDLIDALINRTLDEAAKIIDSEEVADTQEANQLEVKTDELAEEVNRQISKRIQGPFS